MLPPLVLLHGFTQTRQSWRRTVKALAGRYRAITPDLPATARPPTGRASFDACAAYVSALAPAEPFTLAGYSMGGRIALHAAFTLARLDRLILVGASPGLADPKERAQRRRPTSAGRPDRGDRRRGVRDASGAPSRCSPASPSASRAGAYADRLRNTPHGLAERLRGLGTGLMEPLWDRLPELAIP